MAAGLARLVGRPFRVLAREFFDQLFISESGISDHQHRVAMISVLAFLITPGFLMPLQMISMFELAFLRFPALVEPLTRLLATLFLTYAIVVIGVVAAYVWDGLGFDRRDAMVVGPLPLPGRVVIGAKLAALGALLLIIVTAINIMTGVPFAMIASSHKSPIAFGRHLVAHMVATTSAALFVFSALVTLRALLGMVRGGRAALESLLQFALVSALLCFTILTPTSLSVTFPRGPRRGVTPIVNMIAIPEWSPTNWFLGLYETMRGTGHGEFNRAAWLALGLTVAALGAAIATTVVAYRRQFRVALSPSSTPALRSARLARLLARGLAGRNRVARACADFFVTTVTRNRAQQAPVAIITAIGVAFIVIALAKAHADLASFARPRTITLSIPLVLAFWAAVGVRAALYVPSELPASWMFRANAPVRARAYRRAVCATFIALIAPPAVLLAAAVTAPAGWYMAVRHTTFVLLLVVALAELLTLTIDFVPFTRPYRSGHSKLRTRWPLYAGGFLLFAYAATKLELRTLPGGSGFFMLTACIVALIGLLEFAGRRSALGWSTQPVEELADDDGGVTVLDIGLVVHGAHVGG